MKARREEIEGLKQRYEKGLADSKDFEGVLKLVEEERGAFKDELEEATKRAESFSDELEAKAQELDEMKNNWAAFEEFEKYTRDSIAVGTRGRCFL
jgi:hypothetical protein